MEKEVKEDIISILKTAIEVLKVREEGDIPILKDISDHTLHDASIYQDIDSVQIAIITYSLYKLLDRKTLIAKKKYKKIVDELEKAKATLESNKFGRYNVHIQNLFILIRTIDEAASRYIQEVMDKARITKGSKLFAHGLSAKRAAEIMGTSEWDLLKYIGQTKSLDDTPSGSTSVKKRLAHALSLFRQ